MTEPKKIKLTPQEIEEIRDEIKFRERVIIELKQLNGIPKKVWQLEVWERVNWIVTSAIFIGLLGIAWSVIGHIFIGVRP